MYFEDKISPSTADEADFDNDYQEVRSADRSSAGSIPWAEDAIRQNKLEWERIESYFNSEDDTYLPHEDKDLCREILEWKKRFPPKKNSENVTTKEENIKEATIHPKHSSNDSDEDTLIENATTTTLKSTKIPLPNLRYDTNINQNDTRTIQKHGTKSVSFPVNISQSINIQNLSTQFEKDLRINSISSNNERFSIPRINPVFPSTVNLNPQIIPVKVQRHYQYPQQLLSSQSAKYLLEKYPNSIITVEKKISPHSATYTRAQPAYNLLRNGNTKIFHRPIESPYQFSSRFEVSRTGGNKQYQIRLPALNVVRSNRIPSFTNINSSNMRSISAVNHMHFDKRQIRNIPDSRRAEYLPSLSASNKYKYST